MDLLRKWIKKEQAVTDRAMFRADKKEIYMADLYVYSDDVWVMWKNVLVYPKKGDYIDLLEGQLYRDKNGYAEHLNSSSFPVTQLGHKYIANLRPVMQSQLRETIEMIRSQETGPRRSR